MTTLIGGTVWRAHSGLVDLIGQDKHGLDLMEVARGQFLRSAIMIL